MIQVSGSQTQIKPVCVTLGDSGAEAEDHAMDLDPVPVSLCRPRQAGRRMGEGGKRTGQRCKSEQPM